MSNINRLVVESLGQFVGLYPGRKEDVDELKNLIDMRSKLKKENKSVVDIDKKIFDLEHKIVSKSSYGSAPLRHLVGGVGLGAGIVWLLRKLQEIHREYHQHR